mmetsp:Transcript_18216/g.37096  ORF Transcript_18216/g.37096 Transcript_18216/m.37096 type:complete len:204 (+) Transcript_18216:47-658(+)|eukprot:CAMPEP_0119055748 /NCGR_PEP_ID=MMETSP1178-20130426/194_1 /TAXON_ID=33656 /ORGANISM="unid sp, Strain CCMP2000" /LENGTH=203 /DNA_ID=CAMNT_0007036367 /DNA_START=47 /DNA_END=658 /DNA_ORIENTATION=-
MLATIGAAMSGLVLNGPALTSPSTAAPRAAPVMMPVARIPGEGDPFNGGKMRRSEDIATKQPRAISTGEANLQYIETEDEPWHATCRPTSRSTIVSKKVLDKSLSTALPFAAAENALDAAIVAAKSEKQIDEAVKKCLSSGGRPGCPAIELANKQKAAMAKAAKDGKPMPKAKGLNPPQGGGSPGWADQGQGRKLATVHDNSI